MIRLFACVWLVASVAVGCGSPAAPVVPVGDAGRDAAIDLDGGVDLDGSVDGGDGGSTPDGSLPDAGSWCDTSALCPSCPDREALCDDQNPCPTGEVCLATGCGDLSRCFVAGGGACTDDLDCGDPAYVCNLEIGRCLRLEPGCNDSNDCVAGFACEEGACVDRRVPCELDTDCPHGFTCFFASPDQRFCRRISRPCVDDLDCLALGVPCGDVDGDQKRECMPSLTPNEPDPVSCDNTQCTDPTAPVCQSTVQGTRAVCGRFGPCGSSTDCATGFECRDLWGDARPECVLPEGSCMDSRQCPLRSVCASARPASPPACITGVTQ
jgi:hypothetical protein